MFRCLVVPGVSMVTCYSVRNIHDPAAAISDGTDTLMKGTRHRQTCRSSSPLQNIIQGN